MDIIIAWSNSVLRACINRSVFPSPLKLQKLIYLSYGVRLGNGGDIDTRLAFEAWNYGPVLPYVYYQYQQYKNKIIRNFLHNNNGDRVVLQERSNHAVERAIDIFGNMEGYELIDLVHEEGGAWWLAYRNGRNQLIDHQEIRREFANE